MFQWQIKETTFYWMQVQVITRTNAFEANLAAINASKRMLMKALEIGK